MLEVLAIQCNVSILPKNMGFYRGNHNRMLKTFCSPSTHLSVIALLFAGCGSKESSFFDVAHKSVEITIDVPVEWKRNHHLVYVVVLHKLTDNSIGIAKALVVRPRKGFMDRVYYETVEQKPVVSIYSPIGVVDDEPVSSYLFAIKNEDLSNNWKVYEVSRNSLSPSVGSLLLPPFDTLLDLKDHADSSTLQPLVNKASAR